MNLKIDNPFFEVMGRLGDILIVNGLFLLCSLPVVTIGASCSALYGTFLAMAEGREGKLTATFFRWFRSCLKRSTAAWLLMLASGCLLLFDVWFLGRTGMRGLWQVLGIGTGCLILLWEMLYAYLFPLLTEEKEGKRAVRRAMKSAVLYLPATLVMILLNNLPLLAVLFIPRYLGLLLPLYVFAGFGLTGYANTHFLKKCFGIEEERSKR